MTTGCVVALPNPAIGRHAQPPGLAFREPDDRRRRSIQCAGTLHSSPTSLEYWIACFRGRRQLLLIRQGAMCPLIAQPLRPVESRDGAAIVYLLSSSQYQFCNRGVVSMNACRMSTCIEPTLGTTEGNMAKKAKKAKKTKKAKKKKK